MKRYPEIVLLFCLIAYSLGVLAIVFAPTLPNAEFCVGAVIMGSVVLWRHRRCGFILLAFCIGFSWATYRAQMILHFHIPAESINKPVLITGEITDILQKDLLHTRFDFQLLQWENKSIKGHFQLNWYEKFPQLRVGEVWRFSVKVKPPHGLENPGEFDYQRALFFSGVQATGYIVNRQPTTLLAYHPWHHPINYCRQQIIQMIAQSVENPDLAAFLASLTTGSRMLMNAAQERVFEDTGMSYLIVVSGLHISIIASLIYFMVNFIWRKMPKLLIYCPAQRVANYGALLGAWFYGLLAGLTLPTQRALIMISVWIFSSLNFRSITFTRRLLIAVLLIIILQPFSLLTASFWLSFIAIAIVGYLLCARIHFHSSPISQWLWLQFAIVIGLLPLTLFYFQKIAYLTVIANLIALPWVELLMVPGCVLAAFIYFCWHSMGHWFFLGLSYLAWPIWWYLHYLSQLSQFIGYLAVDSLVLLASGQIAIALLLAPRGWPWRWLGVIWALPLLYPRTMLPARGELWMTLLDVGQGLSVLVETAHHRLIFDAGPRFNQIDAGEQIVAPYLHYRHAQSIHDLVVSHGDNDHIGGSAALLKYFRVNEVLTSVPERFASRDAKTAVIHCAAGQAWQWDEVQFQILSPPQDEAYQGNNSSCVLKITAQNQAILLTGDIEKPREKWLLSQYPQQLSATILVAPHHGSRTSSSQAFVEAVRPRYVLFPVGYYNRYKFPASLVLNRYQQLGAALLSTADVGAISIHIEREGKITLQATNQHYYFWQKS